MLPSIASMTTIIESNGSRCAGEAPDTVEQLIELLSREPLDPSFERFGNFILTELRHCIFLGRDQYIEKDLMYPESPGMVRFWGNFHELSHVFQIDTDEPEMIERLTNAIRANQATSAYVSASEKQRGDAEAVPVGRVREQEREVPDSPKVVDAAADQQLTLALL